MLVVRAFPRPYLQERLQQALMQWQHPAAPLPPALLAAQASGSAGAVAAAAGAAAAGGDRGRVDAAAVLLRERAQQWREALRGAYLALRHGHCPLVYLCGQVSAGCLGRVRLMAWHGPLAVCLRAHTCLWPIPCRVPKPSVVCI